MMEVRRLHPEASVIIITAYATVDTAITAMKEGAQEYIVKPCNPQEISLLVNRIMQGEEPAARERHPAPEAEAAVSLPGHRHARTRGCRRCSTWRGKWPSLRSTVLIRGESGTGKELVARAIHNCGRPRRTAVRGGVLRGAGRDAAGERTVRPREGRRSPGAESRRPRASSRWPTAAPSSSTRSATSAPKAAGATCLRVLQERSFYRVGGSEEVRVDVRVIAATNSTWRRRCDRAGSATISSTG